MAEFVINKDVVTPEAKVEVTVTPTNAIPLGRQRFRLIVVDAAGNRSTPDEVIVFKSGDSDPTGAVRVAHTAFTDPTCPPNVPTRASVEMRALAVFD